MNFRHGHWPFRRTEVIFIEILYQGKGIFLFEIVCFKTTNEKKSQLNIFDLSLVVLWEESNIKSRIATMIVTKRFPEIF